MPRIDMLPEFSLVKEIEELMAGFNELKNKQTIGGESIVYHENSNDGWDIEDSGQSFTAKYIRVIFTADTQDYAFADCFPYAEFTYSGTTYVWYPGVNRLISSSIYFDFLSAQPFPDPTYADDQSIVGFLFAIYTDPAVSFKIKFYVVSNDTGTIQVSYI